MGVNCRPNEPPTKPAAIGILADGNYGGSLGGGRYLHERDSCSSSRQQSAASRDPHESQLGRLRSGTSRTNPPLAGETLDELHGLVNYFGIAFAYAFGYARFQMFAQQHF